MKVMQGIVVSLSSKATAKVEVIRQWQHPLYKKSVKRSKKYLCHYEKIDLVKGEEVMIQETKPISKNKHFVVMKKVETTA